MTLYISTILCLSTALACAARLAGAQYTLHDTFDIENFFDEFNFFSGADPTNGLVSFASAETANETALAGYSSNAVYLGADHTSMNTKSGRQAVRVSSKQSYTHGLFIADIAHMPGGICGVWPAFWTFGPNWPGSGEIDIIEGVNAQQTNIMTLHTTAGCTMSNHESVDGTSLQNGNCNMGNGNAGCSQTSSDPRSFGAGFNSIGGGVFAMDWTSNAINIYFFPRDTIPADISANTPDPSSWGSPLAGFSATGCNIDQHFMNHNIVFDTTFCGDWAGKDWGNGACASQAPTCSDFVANHPQAFADAYWLINYVQVYRQTGSKRETPFVA